MSAKETILRILSTHKTGLCDDCLLDVSRVKPRQQVNQRARDLEKEDRLVRRRDKCPNCHRRAHYGKDAREVRRRLEAIISAREKGG